MLRQWIATFIWSPHGFTPELVRNAMKELSDKEVEELVDEAFDRYAGSWDEIVKAIGEFIIAR